MSTQSFKRLSIAAVVFGNLTACTTMTAEPGGASNKLLKFNAGRPDRILAKLDITGLQAGETLLGIDYRVAKDQLYTLGSSGRLYTINEDSAVASAVGEPFAVKLYGMQFAF